MFAYLTPKIFFIDMHFGLHTKAGRDPVVVFPQLHNTLPSPHMISDPSKAKQYSDIQFDICFRGPCSCCNSKRRRHRMLHANFIWSMYLYLLFIVCVGGMFVGQMCACVRTAALRTFQIIYFGIGGCYLYLWDLRVKFSLGFPLRLRIGNWKC